MTKEKILEEFDKEFPDARIIYPQDLNINLNLFKDVKSTEIPRLKRWIIQDRKKLLQSVVEMVGVEIEKYEPAYGNDNQFYVQALSDIQQKLREIIK